ncbi:MAG: DUF5320 domain-containing protein, partial [Desulfohalobiaceae bacterium]|nr:DUF5320 domain-containing protein [Desulfohalobiaceae bacterium]
AGNGTGPMGFGPMTGRAAGYCAGFGRPGHMTPGPGRGMGFGFRGGGGRRRRGVRGGQWFGQAPGFAPWGAPAAGYAGPSRQQEREMLQGQIEHMENALSELKQRLSELETERQQGGEG